MLKIILQKNNTLHVATALLALATVSFHIYLVFTGLIPNLISRPIHLAFAFTWVFLFDKNSSVFVRYFGYLLLFLSLLSSFYIVFNHLDIEEQYGSLEGNIQYFISVILLISILEAARRSVKLALPITAFIALLYGLFGDLIPGDFGHQEIPLSSFLGTMVMSEGGIYGILTGVSVNVIAIFVILGAYVGIGEGGNAFISLSSKIAGKLTGGAAKVSVLASAFFGSISGSASANVASTGAFTIPSMKRLGYPSTFAAAVEAVASTGGQIMPPLMGAGAFIMAELLGESYNAIMAAAIFPAILFFITVWMGVDIFAKKYNLLAMKEHEIPSITTVLQLLPFFAIPFGILLYALLILNKTPQYSAAMSIFAAIILLITDRSWHLSPKKWFLNFIEGSIIASKQIAAIASIIICAGIIIGVLNITGVGVKITSAILYIAHGQLWIALILTALACLILGMEVPTTAAYIICVAVAGPILQEFGLNPLTTHLFIFWFALLSTITPPVCGTVFIASGIADANWIKVASISIRLGIGLYIIPVAFITNRYLIYPDKHFLYALFSFIKIFTGLLFISNALIKEYKNFMIKIAVLFLGFFIAIYPI